MDTCIILLTYKEKILLMLKSTRPTLLTQSTWSFIGIEKDKHRTFEETILDNVEKETGIKLEKVELLSKSLYNGNRKYFYHAKLSDKEVNSMKREEGKMLQFFTLKELEGLALATATRFFVTRHYDILQKMARARA